VLGRALADLPPNVAPSMRPIADAVLKAICQSIAKGVPDRVLEHSLIYALIQIGDRERTSPYLSDPNPQVRRAALIALDQMENGDLTREQVVPLLDTDDPALQQTTLEIIARHDGWAGETLGLLRGWITADETSNERLSVLRGFLLAQAQDDGVQRLVGEALSDLATNRDVRLALLEVVERSRLTALPDAWKDGLDAALAHTDVSVRLQAVQAIESRGTEEFDARLHDIATDGSTREERLAALRTIAPRMKTLTPELFNFLIAQLDADVASLDRLSAARALADAPLSGEQLLGLAARFDTAGPLALPVLLRAFERSQDARVGRALVDALHESPAAANLSADELSRILQNYPPDVQSAAAPLLKRLGIDLAARQTRLEELASLGDGGDAERGRQVFFSKKSACSSCHTIAGEGGRVGPDLTTIGRIRTSGDLLEAIVFPSSSFARGYRSYVLVTDEGRVHTGLITRQSSDTLTLRTAELAELHLPRARIEEMRESPVSLMPKGFDQTLSEGELRDLLAYLRARK
ncbi:MAG: c-type cytochrome, partial [Planctomycetaceae bacterium]